MQTSRPAIACPDSARLAPYRARQVPLAGASLTYPGGVHKFSDSSCGLPIVLMVGCLVLSGCSSRPSSQQQTKTTESASQPALEEFELTTSTGASMRSQDLDGKVWVASYFFTQCGSNCRMLNMEVAKLSQEYGPRGVHFVSLTCDPRNDTPTALASYAQLFNANGQFWTFTTGELDYLQRIGTDLFEISVSERAHHARITIMDQQGVARGTFDILEQNELKRATKLLEELLAAGQESLVEDPNPESEAANS